MYRSKPEGGPRVQAKRGGPEGSKKAAKGGIPKQGRPGLMNDVKETCEENDS